MKLTPDIDHYVQSSVPGRPGVVWAKLVTDLETPISAWFKLAANRPDSLLLESVEGGNRLGRYSVLALSPDLIWRTRDGVAEVNRAAEIDPDAGFTPMDQPPLEALRTIIDETRMALPDELPPMAAGLFGYLGYDMVRYMEDLPDSNPDLLGVPEAVLLRPRLVAIFDNIERDVTLVASIWPKQGEEAAAAYKKAEALISDAYQALSSPLPSDMDGARLTEAGLDTVALSPTSNMPEDAYHQAVEKAVSYTLAGDIFQVVPSQRFSTPFSVDSFEYYRSLRRLNPSPFLFHLNLGNYAIVGSSPEILVRVREGTVTIRPIAGTRKRGTNVEEDMALAEDLLADEKERAEHLMLLDLGRNDVGRVSQPGTVKVTEQMVIEKYSHVMHIVSNVEGKLKPDLDALDALVAGFPAGTVSGAPKVRAMEIIDELETCRRGVYAGCIGYFGAGGDMDTCIALRTAVIKDDTLHVQAGGGVVCDSTAEGEYQETVNKARALFRAAEDAIARSGGEAKAVVSDGTASDGTAAPTQTQAPAKKERV